MFDATRLHHAYFIEGERDVVLAVLDDFLEKDLGVSRHGHPDIHVAHHDSFGIDEARDIQSMQSVKPVQGDRKIFIISVGAITNEAQNSLLKVFEEPTAGTHFFIIASTQRILLPTLRSRLIVVSHTATGSAQSDIDPVAFISMGSKERLEAVAPLIEEKDKEATGQFLASLIKELHGAGLESVSVSRVEAIREITSLSQYIQDRSPSIKLILERIALLDLV